MFANGSGTIEDPYLVSSMDDFKLIAQHMDKHFLQTQDLDFADEDDWGSHLGDIYPASFTGFYDGGGFKILNLRLANENEFGLFYSQSSGGEFQHMVFEHCLIARSGGFLAEDLDGGRVEDFSFKNCAIETGGDAYCGMVANKADNVNITDITFVDCSIESDESYSGFIANWLDVGSVQNASFTRCTKDKTRGGLIADRVDEANITDITILDCTLVGTENIQGGFLSEVLYESVISNVSLTNCSAETFYQVGGLASLVDDGTATNVFIENLHVRDAEYCGIVAGSMDSETISGVTVTNSSIENAVYAGGVAYELYECEASEITLKNITMENINFGGLFASDIRYTSAHKCKVTGAITGSEENAFVSGFVYRVYNYTPVSFSELYVNASVCGEQTGALCIKQQESETIDVENCYFKVRLKPIYVSGARLTASVLGERVRSHDEPCNVTHCLFEIAIESSPEEGPLDLFFFPESKVIDDSYYNKNALASKFQPWLESQEYQVGNICAGGDGELYVRSEDGWVLLEIEGAKTEEELQEDALYLNWDMENIWDKLPDFNGGKPFLRFAPPEPEKKQPKLLILSEGKGMDTGVYVYPNFIRR